MSRPNRSRVALSSRPLHSRSLQRGVCPTDSQRFPMKQRRSRRAMVALAACVLSVGLMPARAAESSVKVAFIYVDPVGDTGWSYQHDLARRELARVLGAQVK